MGTHDALCLDWRAVGFGPGNCLCITEIKILIRMGNRTVHSL